MKKVIFCNIPLRKGLVRQRYQIDWMNKTKEAPLIAFPITFVLSTVLKHDDDVKVVLLAKDDVQQNNKDNIQAFRDELNTFNENIGAHIEYASILIPNVEQSDTHEWLLKEMIAQVPDGSEIYCDITYGTKPTPIISISAMNFLEKYCQCEIKNIVYGKIDFIQDENGTIAMSNPVIFDVSSLFFLNKIANVIDCDSGEHARKMLEVLLNL